MTDIEFKDVRNILLEIGKIVQKYGNEGYYAQMRIMFNAIKLLDSDEANNVKSEYCVDVYKALFQSREGLSDFYIHDDDFETRIALNKPLTELKENLWSIMKKYV